jgi:exosortase
MTVLATHDEPDAARLLSTDSHASAIALAATAPAQSRWMPWLIAMLAAGFAAWIAADAWIDLSHLSIADPEASHVLLVPVIFLWLAWVRRGRLQRCQIMSGRWPGVIFIAAGWILWSQGYHYQIQSFWHFGAIVLAAGAALTVLGQDVLLRFLPAWAVLVFLVPVPGRVHAHVAIPLERITALATQSLSEVLGINIGRSGNQLSVNGVDVCIAEACNGMRMVFTLFMACYVFAYIRPLRGWVRLLVLLASPVVAIACNVIRLVPTVWMFGHVAKPTADSFHEAAGWFMLVLAFAVLTGISNLMHWMGLPVYSSVPSNSSALSGN